MSINKMEEIQIFNQSKKLIEKQILERIKILHLSVQVSSVYVRFVVIYSILRRIGDVQAKKINFVRSWTCTFESMIILKLRRNPRKLDRVLGAWFFSWFVSCVNLRDFVQATILIILTNGKTKLLQQLIFSDLWNSWWFCSTYNTFFEKNKIKGDFVETNFLVFE